MTHEQVELRLPELAAGTLSAAERPLVERHLAVCSKCRDTVEFCQRVARLLRRIEDAHPAAARLAELGVAPERLDAPTRTELELHVADCPGCRDELERVRAVEEDVAAAAGVARVPVRARIRAATPVAAAALLALALGAGLGLWIGAGPAARRAGGRGERAEGLVDFAVLVAPRQGLRGAATPAAPPLLTLVPDADLAVLELRFAPGLVLDGAEPESSHRFAFAVESARGDTVWTSAPVGGGRIARELRAAERVVVAVPAATLGAGRHEVVLRRHDRDSDPVEIVRIPFVVQRQSPTARNAPPQS